MALLETIEKSGYPDDYVLARVRVRRSSLMDDWEQFASAAEPMAAIPVTPRRGKLTFASDRGVWNSMQEEFAWLYGQMENNLRRIFEPVFGWFELRTLIICLRDRHGWTGAEAEGVLARSLLDSKVKRLLIGGGETGQVIAALCPLLTNMDRSRFAELHAVYAKEGFQGFERQMLSLYLEHVLRGGLHPLVREFFCYMVDMTNLMDCYKRMRWLITSPQPFIRGGRIRVSTLGEALTVPGMAGLHPLVGRVAGMAEQTPSGGSPELVLLRGLSRLLRRRSREPGGGGLILYYLWSCWKEARNLCCVLHAAGERESLRRELLP